MIQTMRPGSPEAVKNGCTCAVEDNFHGEGAFKLNGVAQYYITEGCPIHDVISDGFGSMWPAVCPKCGQRAMQVQRPGFALCGNCEMK